MSTGTSGVALGRPLVVAIVAILLALATITALVGGIYYAATSDSGEVASDEAAAEGADEGLLQIGPGLILVATLLVTALLAWLAWGMWRTENWARSGFILLLMLVGVVFGTNEVLAASAEVFGGEQIQELGNIIRILAEGFLRALAYGAVPIILIVLLMRLDQHFMETQGQRAFVDRAIRYVLIAAAASAIVIVFLIIVFTMSEAWESVTQLGLDTMLLGTVWRPGSIIGTEDAQLGLVPMIVGSILSTFGAVLLGVPLSVMTAVLLAEVAPQAVREVVRPAIELLAGIPSVVYGLFGMVVLAPLIRQIEVPYNTGFGILNASIILAVMIIPTVTNIAEDAIRAVPEAYKQGSLALGTTHWQTIVGVILPAARSGILAAVILGIGRALGETMAVIMVIGNAIAIPAKLNDNPLTMFLSSARTLTGNIAVEINYAAGTHRSALFFTGVLLFVMILLINTLARYMMRERLSS